MPLVAGQPLGHLPACLGVGGAGQEDKAVNAAQNRLVLLHRHRYNAVGILHRRVVPANDPIAPELKGDVTSHVIHTFRRSGHDSSLILQDQVL